jgi:3-phosphoshikimate 1-carboxyvinyltransferase
LAALTKGTTTLKGVLFSDDTRVMIEALRSLGFELIIDEKNLTISLQGGIEKIQATGQTIFLGNSGTSMRFLTALCSIITD